MRKFRRISIKGLTAKAQNGATDASEVIERTFTSFFLHTYISCIYHDVVEWRYGMAENVATTGHVAFYSHDVLG